MKQKVILDPIGPNETDSTVYFRRPNGELYAVLSPEHHNQLKRKKQLEPYLQHRRESGIVLEIIR